MLALIILHTPVLTLFVRSCISVPLQVALEFHNDDTRPHDEHGLVEMRLQMPTAAGEDSISAQVCVCANKCCSVLLFFAHLHRAASCLQQESSVRAFVFLSACASEV